MPGKGKMGPAPDTGTSYPGKYVSDKTKLSPGKSMSKAKVGGAGPAKGIGTIGRKRSK